MEKDVDYVLIGKRITEAREEAGFNKKELAERIGKAASTVGRYEKGSFKKISIGEIQLIAKVLGVNPVWLQGESDDKEIPAYNAQLGEFTDKDGTAYVPAGHNISEPIMELRVDEHQLLGYYNQLNDVGKTKAMTDISDMTELPKYTKDTSLKNA